jgi:hypothetical protein
MKLFKSKRMIAVWGSQEPQELIKIIVYLHAQGFEGPTADSTLHFFNFTRRIDDDLELHCALYRQGEWPEHIFNFASSLCLASRFLLRTEHEINFYPDAVRDPKQTAQAIFCITLEHLIWNAQESDINPGWKTSTLPGYEKTSQEWIESWEKHMLPIIHATSNGPDAIEFCKGIPAYKPNLWVRSKGYLSVSFDTYLAILMTGNNQVSEAKEWLTNALKNPKNAEVQRRLALTLDWVNNKSQ